MPPIKGKIIKKASMLSIIIHNKSTKEDEKSIYDKISDSLKFLFLNIAGQNTRL